MVTVLAILLVTLIAVLVWAAVVAVRQFSSDVARAARKPRFGLVDLLLLISTICCAMAAVRWLWSSVYLGIALLLIPMVLPLAWLAKFAVDDARLAREKRKQRREAVVESFDVPIPDETAEPVKARRKSPKLKPIRTWMPALSPLSLLRSLKDDD